MAFDAKSGKPVWHIALLPDAYDPDDPSGNFAPVPLLGDGVLSILTGSILVAFQGSSGGLLRQVQVTLDGEYQLEEPPFPMVKHVGGTAYVVALVQTARSSQLTSELVAYAPSQGSSRGMRLANYSKPSAKAPLIHPGDEAPFLVW